MTAKAVQARCAPAFVKADETCTIGEFATIGTVAERPFAYARYDFMPARDGSLPYSRVVIFESTSPAMFRPVLISGDDAAYIYGKPEIIRSFGRLLLHIPAAEDATGNLNCEILYAWDGDGWQDVDVASWGDELTRRLPRGRQILKGVFPNYSMMIAETPLWREGDGPICATGGRLHVALQMRGNRIGVVSLRAGKAGDCGEPLRR